MKFHIYRTMDYKPDRKKMLETYPALVNYNFRTVKSGNSYVTINSIQQLMQMVKEIGQEIILAPYDNSIEIYDEYRE